MLLLRLRTQRLLRPYHAMRNACGGGREAKFGMFVHWGLYSLLCRDAWAMGDEDIPLGEYEQLAGRFQPQANAARAWAKLARKSGMKYMVMTAKHHEGFCLFSSKLTDYCATKQGPRRDLVQEYVEAARAEGLRVGLYLLADGLA